MMFENSLKISVILIFTLALLNKRETAISSKSVHSGRCKSNDRTRGLHNVGKSAKLQHDQNHSKTCSPDPRICLMAPAWKHWDLAQRGYLKVTLKAKLTP